MVLGCAQFEFIISQTMSIEKEFEIYTYTLTILNLTLKIKFPCKIYLDFNGQSLTSQVAASSPNKFTFNQEVTLKNQTDKDYIQVLVQLVTDKGAKYVGGVLKFVQSELIGSQGERITVPISKCLDSDAFCEVRVDQVATSRVSKRNSPKKRAPLKSEYQPQINVLWSNPKNKFGNEGGGGQTKSQYGGFPMSVNRTKERFQVRGKQPTIGGPSNMKKSNRINELNAIDKQGAMSMAGGAGMSALEFEVYKEGYNKLKDKYRKQAETARAELNKRMALESNENNLKLQLMRYKLKTEELQKSVQDKNIKIKELTESISGFQKKQLDTKYLKEEVQNKNYTIKNLQETIKTLTRDNGELKNLQNSRAQNQQDTIKSLKEDIQKLKRQLQARESQALREIRSRNDAMSKKEYQLHTKSQELERARCAIQDLQKSMSNKTFEWERIQQSDRNTFKMRQEELKDKIAKLQTDKTNLEQRVKDHQQSLEEKRSQILRIQYDKKVVVQNNQSLQKQNEDLRLIKQKYVELIREHKMVGEQRNQLEKNKDREGRQKDVQIEELAQRLNTLTQSSKKSLKDLQEKLKANQVKLIQTESANQLLRNQLDKAKRQNQVMTKQSAEIKNQLKQTKIDSKEKEERLLALTNQLTDSKNRSKQGDYSSKLQLDRFKQQVQKLAKSLEQQKNKNAQLTEGGNKLELQNSKAKMEWQFKEEKAIKQLNYAKEKIASLQTFKQDLQNQIVSSNQSVANLKASEKLLNQKIQKMQLQAIKSREIIQKSKKQIKVYQEKLQNSENNNKNKLKELTDQQQFKDNLDKKIVQLQTEISQTKNDLNKEINQKARNQKIVEILQVDLAKGKEEQTRLNAVITTREKAEEELRDELKKQKEEYTKLDMKLSALRKEYEKFKDTLIDNLQTVFGAIPQGLSNSPIRGSKISYTSQDKRSRQNSQILNLLTTLGKDARSNMAKLVQQFKSSQRENQKLNNQFSTTVNKCNTSEFQYNQNINRLEEEISQLLAEKQNVQNKYEEEVFLLEGRIREKEASMAELSQQIQQIDFTYKNTRAELDAFREEVAKKDANRNKLINELRQQIQYHVTQIDLLENNLQKNQEELDACTNQLEDKFEKVNKLQKDLFDLRQMLQISQDQAGTLKRELKKSNQKNQELNLQLISEKDQIEKLRNSIEEQQRKAAELRQFLSGLMKQKEEIIKKELEKSQQILQFETHIEQLKHQNQWLSQQVKKYKKSEEENKESIKKLTKSLKQQQTAKNQERTKNTKLNDKIKEKQKEVASRDQVISKLQEKIKKEKEKMGKDVKELEAELDETYMKLLNKQKQNNQKIISLENEVQKLKIDCQKLREENVNTQQALLIERNKNEDYKEEIGSMDKKIIQYEEKIKRLEDKERELEEDNHAKEEQTFKLQGKIYNLEGKVEQKQNEKNDKIDNFNNDWSNKYDSMCEQYEQRIQMIEKQKQFLKERSQEKEKEIKKLGSQLKMQQNNISIMKKSYEEKIKSVEDDRLLVLSQKNTENQRLTEESRVNFDSLKTKQSQCRKLTSELELTKATANKLETKLKQSEQKIRNLNRTYLTEVQQMKKKEQNFKRIKENAVSSIWKSQRQVRRVIQASIKKIIEVVDEQSTMKVMEVTKTLEQNVVAAISIKIEQKQQ